MVLVAVAVALWLTDTVGETAGMILVVGAVVVEGVEIWLWIKYLKRFRVKTGVEAMVGQTATVAERCDPEGSVRYQGEIWSARCERGATKGDAVVIRGVDRLKLHVEPVGGDGQSSSS